MSSIKSTLSGSDCTSHDGRSGDIIKMGYLKKLKTMKKKFFVLRSESSEASARLEYYDSEKKWKSHHSPKRSISLKTCFNINRIKDAKQKHVIALYTKEDNFCVVLENEEEVEDWLRALLNLQHGEQTTNGEKPKPKFEHVWDVTVQKKGLGSMKNILGGYHLCLTDKTLSLVKFCSNETKNESYEFSLMSIRRCGHSDCFFYMEVGRLACTGAGDLWMLTEDPNIAENMHAAILHAMSNNNSNKSNNTPTNIKEDTKETKRMRSSSASFMNRWQNHGNLQKPGYHTDDGNRHTRCGVSESSAMITPSDLINQLRDRSDSMPSRARTSSEGHSSGSQSSRNIHLVPGHLTSRPYSMNFQLLPYNPLPVGSSPVSPASGACSTDSAGSSLSMDDTECWTETSSEGPTFGRYLHPLTPDEPAILEEEYAPWENNLEDKNIAPGQQPDSHSVPIQTVTTQRPQRTTKYTSNNSYKSNSPLQNSYMEMYSPCGSSPMDQGSSYLPMSPGDPGGHSHASSLTEEGYVPMGPPTTDDGYVDMDPNPRNGFQNSEASPGSSSSLTSGTPSTDIRFSEYHLEKVTSYFPPCEEEERHPRAYSVGSRPENKHIRKEPNNTTGHSCRVRAFSVGSRISPALRLSWVPQLAQHCPTTSAAASTPHLSSSWSGVTPSTKYQISTDLMEMDFSRNSLRSNKSSSKKPSNDRLPISSLTTPPISTSNSSLSTSTASPSTAEGALEMIFSQKDSHIFNKSHENIKSGPYVEMKAIDARNSPPNKIWPNRSPKLQSSYVDMNIPKTPPIKSPPTTTSSSLENDYVQMNEYINDPEEKSQNDYIEMTIKPETNVHKISNVHENYVDMNWKKSTEDYANTLQDNKLRNNRKEKNRNSSQPIAIQTPCVGIPSSRGRKRSTGTPPKPPPSFLALGLNNSPSSSPYNSLRHKSRETLDANTPSSSTGIIFPFSLNSPGSPVKPFISYDGARKCPVDATNGTIRISYLPSECPSPISNNETPDSSSSSELPTPVNPENITEIPSPVETNDYVNCNPTTVEKPPEGEYTFMKPKKIPSKKSDSLEFINTDFNLQKTKKNTTLNSDSVSNSIVTQTITSSSSKLRTPYTTNLIENKDVMPGSTYDAALTSSTYSISNVIVSSIESNQSQMDSTSNTVIDEKKQESNESFKDTNQIDENVSENDSFVITSNSSNIVNSSSKCGEYYIIDHTKMPSSFTLNENKLVDNKRPSCFSEDGEEVNSSTLNDSSLSQFLNNSLNFSKNEDLNKINLETLLENIKPSNMETTSSIINNSETEQIVAQLENQTNCDYKTLWNPAIQKDKELHYASLDLSEEGRETNCASNPATEDPAFTYAQIDFGKSGGLTTASSSLNRKMLH